jgi:hypothetical protein
MSDQPKQFDMIIGIDLLDKIGSCTVDFNRKEIIFRDAEKRASYLYKIDPKENRLIIRCHAGKTWTMGNPQNSPVLPPIPRVQPGTPPALRQAQASSSTGATTSSANPRRASPRRNSPNRAQGSPTNVRKAPTTNPPSLSPRGEEAIRTKMRELNARYNIRDDDTSGTDNDIPARAIHTVSSGISADQLESDWQFTANCLNGWGLEMDEFG